MANGSSAPTTVTLSFWKFVILLAVNLGGILLSVGVVYGKLTQQMNDLGERVGRIESSRTVGRDEFDDLRNELRAVFRELQRAILEEKLK